MNRIREERMTLPDASAERLHMPHVEELRRSRRPPVHPLVNGTQTQSMIRRAPDARLGL